MAIAKCYCITLIQQIARHFWIILRTIWNDCMSLKVRTTSCLAQITALVAAENSSIWQYQMLRYLFSESRFALWSRSIYLARYKFPFKLYETTNKQLHSLTIFYFLLVSLKFNLVHDELKRFYSTNFTSHCQGRSQNCEKLWRVSRAVLPQGFRACCWALPSNTLGNPAYHTNRTLYHMFV
jgi:hypothetical protein